MLTIDSLICSRMDREAIDMTRRGGIDCVTVTCGFWEDATESMDSIVRWRELLEENADIATLVQTPNDIETARQSGRLAVVLGFQNSSFLQGRLGYVELFKLMDVHVAQLTYNIQNDIGGSCYDPHDSGLTRFGAEVVEEMNRVGMIIDCSHVGDRTTLDAIEASRQPIAITHANPRSLIDHPRNKSDAVLQALRETNGMLGVTMYHNITRGYHETVDEWARMVARTVELVGIDCVGVGTDTNTHGSPEYLRWMRSGRWSRRAQTGATVASAGPLAPSWYRSPEDHTNIEEALRRTGFDESSTAKVLGRNWLDFYEKSMKPQQAFVAEGASS